MRKIFLSVIFAVLLSVNFTPQAYAKSGCCSGHGGVSCGAGPQSDGSVICNDGWTGSSCSYSGMVMCGGSSASAPQPVPAEKTQPEVLGITEVKTIQPKASPQPVKPKITAKQLKEQREKQEKLRCDRAVKTLQTTISTQEKKKEKNLTQLFTAVEQLREKATASKKSAEDISTFNQKIDLAETEIKSYQQAYDHYTNTLYKMSWVACDLDKTQLTTLQKQEKILLKPLAAQFLMLQRQVTQLKQ